MKQSTTSSTYISSLEGATNLSKFTSNDDKYGDSKEAVGRGDGFENAKRYIERLNSENKTLANEVFSPFIAKINSFFLGMNYFGGHDGMFTKVDAKKIEPPIQGFKYFAYHMVCWIQSIVTLYPLLFLSGFNMQASIVAAAMANGGIFICTPWPEIKIFTSKFIALRLRDANDKIVKDIKKTVGASDLGMFVGFSLIYTLVFVIVPGFSLIIPYVRETNQVHLEYVLYFSCCISALIGIINIGMAKWQPLVTAHQKEILKGIKHSIEAIEAIIYNQEDIDQKVAQEKLTYLSKNLIKPIQHDLMYVWGAEILSIFVGIVPSLAVGLYILFPHIISEISPKSVPNVSKDFLLGLRILIGMFAMLFPPMICFFTIKDSAAPYNLWHKFEKNLHQYASNKSLALDKFNGNHEALMVWLTHNRIALYLGGYAIDHDLPSKILGAFASIFGAICFLLLRAQG